MVRMIRLLRSKARHGFRAMSLTSYMLISPALADSQLLHDLTHAGAQTKTVEVASRNI